MANINISWAGFFDNLGPPKDVDDAVKRIKSNFQKFMYNYIIIAFVIVALLSYMVNSNLLAVLIIVAITAGIMLAVKGTLQIGGVKVNDYHKAGILAVEAFIGLWWTETFNALLWLLCLASIVLLVHAVLRPAQGKFSTMADEVKSDFKNLENTVKKSK